MESDLQAARDELARVLGYVPRETMDILGPCVHWSHPQHTTWNIYKHPIPSTIDGLAGLWPEGWEWEMECRWYGPLDRRVSRYDLSAWPRDRIYTPNTLEASDATEYGARLRLTLAVLKAKGSHD